MGLKIEYGNAGYIETDYDASKSLLGHKEGSVGRLYDYRTSSPYPGPYNTGYKLTNLLFSFPFKYPLAQAGEDPWLWPFDEWVKIITPRQVHISDFHSFHRLQYQNGNPMPVGDVSWGTPYFGPCRASETKYLYKIIGPGKSGTVNGMVGNLSKEVTYTFTHPNCKTNTTAGSGSTLGTNPKVIEVFNTIEVENGMTVTGDGIPANTTVAEVLSSSLVRLNNDVTATSSGYIQLTFSGPKTVAQTENNPYWDKWQTDDISDSWVGSLAHGQMVDTRKSYHLYFTEDLYRVKAKVTLKNSISLGENWDNPYSHGATGTDFVANASNHSYAPGEYEVYGHQLFEGNGSNGKLKNYIGDRGAWSLYNPTFMIEQEYGDGPLYPEHELFANPNSDDYVKYLPDSPMRSSVYGDPLDPGDITVKLYYSGDGNTAGWVANYSNGPVGDTLTHPTTVWDDFTQHQPSGGQTYDESQDAWVGSYPNLEPGRGYLITPKDASSLVNADGDSIFPESQQNTDAGTGGLDIQVWGDSVLLNPDNGVPILSDFVPNVDWSIGDNDYPVQCSTFMWFGDICDPTQSSTYPMGQGVKWYNLVIPNNSERANWYPQPGEGDDSTGQDNPNFGKSYWTVICPTDYTTFPMAEVGGHGTPFHYAGFAPLESMKWWGIPGGFNDSLGYVNQQNQNVQAETDYKEYHIGTLRTTSTSGFYWMNALTNSNEAKPLLDQDNFHIHQYESFWAKYWYDPMRQDHFASMGGRIGCHQWNKYTKEDHLNYMAQYGGGTLGEPSSNLGFYEEEKLHPLIEADNSGVLNGGDKIHWKVRERQHQLGMQRSFHGPYGQMPEWQDDFNGFTMENWGREGTGIPRYAEEMGSSTINATWWEIGGIGHNTEFFIKNTTNDGIPVHHRSYGKPFWERDSYGFATGKNYSNGNMFNRYRHKKGYKKQWPERAPGFNKSNPGDGSYSTTSAGGNTGDKISGYSMPFTWLFWNGSTNRFYKVRPVIVRWKNCYDDGVPINNPVERMCFYYYADNHRIYMNDLRNRTTTSAHEANYPSQEFWSDGNYYDGSDNLTDNNGLNHGPSIAKQTGGMGDTPCSHVGSFMDYTCPSVLKHSMEDTQSYYEDYSTSGNGATYSDHYTIDGIESGSRDAQLNFYCGKYVREGHAKNGTIQPVNDKTSAYIPKITLLDGTETYQYTHRHYMMIQDGTSVTFNTAMETSGPFERDKNLETESGE